MRLCLPPPPHHREAMVVDDEKRELRVSSVTFERGELHFLYTTCLHPTCDT